MIKLPFKAAWFPFKIIGSELIKPILIRLWARKLANRIHATTYKQERKNEPKNICGSGGQYNQPMIRSWNSIYDDEHSLQKVDWSKKELTLAAKESLFFGYFGPLEAWCEKYLTGDFALWSDDKNVYLLIHHEYDQTYFALKWGGKLPHFSGLEAEFSN